MNVLIVEDSAIVADRLKELLSRDEHIHLVGCESEPAGAIRQITSENVEAVLLDFNLNDGNGFDVLRFLKGRADAPIVVVLTNYSSGLYREMGAALGAHYFFDKSTEFEAAVLLLQQLASGGSNQGQEMENPSGEWK